MVYIQHSGLRSLRSIRSEQDPRLGERTTEYWH